MDYMITKIRIFWNLIKDGIRGIWIHKSMALASIVTTTAALVLVAFVLIAALTITTVTEDLKTRVDEIEIFLETNATDENKDNIENLALSYDGIDSITYKSSADALNTMMESWGADAYIFEGLEGSEILPDSYIVRMNDIDKSEAFVSSITNAEGVYKVTYYGELVEQVSNISKYVYYSGVAAILILIVISVFIISNTIKLALQSRKREIAVKKYVGATNSLITGPFIFEGIFFGLISSILSFLIMYFGYNYLYQEFSNELYSVVATYLIRPSILYLDIGIILSVIGIGVGIIGSVVSLRKHLKV